MHAALPNLADYEVSDKTGFLPEQLPLESLTNPYYAPWEQVAQNLPALILTRRIRQYVDTRMPVLEIDQLKTPEEQRRAYSVLSFIAHAYIWGSPGDDPRDYIPPQITEPWVAISDLLELPPVCTYAGLCLWNHKTIMPVASSDQWDLDSLATITTYTGSFDESWFYLVSTTMERQGGACIKAGLGAIAAARENDFATVTSNLQYLAEAIDAIITLLGRMYEMCEPHTFYHRLRPYLSGSENMADRGLPHGVKYQTRADPDPKEYRAYAGGSNAQSSLIQTLDILLNVEHRATGQRPTSKKDNSTRDASPPASQATAPPKQNNFIHEMRKYMPGPHRRFLEHLQQVAEIRDFVLANQAEHPEIVLAYDACLAMLRSFRDKHIQIVSRYIILQAKEKAKTGIALTAPAGPERGTGGTALIPFLKQARDETGDPAASSWGKRILSDNFKSYQRPAGRPKKTKISKPTEKIHSSSEDEDTREKNAVHLRQKIKHKVQNLEDNSEDENVGLAGNWELGKDEGKIIHW
ncbi:Indoleamine 2,3-dioxygenase [Yarrowia lipolytica]|jgi:indoleamine 2,3-dioxygenase|uniref:Indoleamine 2,3-dioxygenase n=1 Tax=Yarrowia lipolytica TaxID=4952 RepID=A0A371BZC1_YARLL|nr:Indoleamine 2,3-dioxygenase [Yarrowia lipolytica]RDW23435.1 Indoleamine 2,3-dioxygenase [Yarrowia lipolytica]RDW35553.1 Indoleamine 2,3-dioxygenase [Yarrowia lipolytica]RDW41980.1 Indoleamine 2,3-dioxygenase [Yarrowia lipolytica]RDW46466.1 Indoleamine 2,3-dioxygenase [Yarrowia lipolytica]